jgi:hypothetical protein
MKPAGSKPEGWQEPIEEGLWAPDLLWEIPRWWNLHHPVFIGLGIIYQTKWPFVVEVILHATLAALTRWDPEWMETLSDWLKEPSEIEP